MKRAGFLFLVPVLVVFVGAIPVSAQGADEQGVMTLTFYPRPGGNDAIDMCSDHNFQDENEAVQFARTLAPELGFGPGSINYDTTNAKDCVTLSPEGGFSEQGPGPHARSFRFVPQPVFDEAKAVYKMEVLLVAVCVPSLPSIVSPHPDQTISGSCDHPLDHEDDWSSDVTGGIAPIDVRFRATPETMLLGILGDMAFWLLAVGILLLVARRQRRKEWRFFIRHRFWAWVLNVILMLVLLFGAVTLGPYWSSWVQSLQLYLHLGVPGEAFVVTLPALTLCTFMIAGPIRQVRHFRPSSPLPAAVVPTPAGPPTLAVPDWWGAQRTAVDAPARPQYEIGPTGKRIPPADSVRFLMWPRWGVLHPWRFSFAFGIFEGVFAAGLARYSLRLHPVTSLFVGMVFGALYFVTGPIQVARWTPEKEERTRRRFERMPAAFNILRWPPWAAVVSGGLVAFSFLGQAIRVFTQGKVFEGLWIVQLAITFPLVFASPAIRRRTRERDHRGVGRP